MTVAEAIERTDALQPNIFTTEQKLFWLDTLDRELYQNVICTHEGAEETSFSGYPSDMDEDTQSATELLVPAPYDRLYLYWLMAMIDFANSEITRYNNSISMYNSDLSAYTAWYNRTHAPIGSARFLF